MIVASRRKPTQAALKELNKCLMKLMDMNIIKYRIVDARDIGVQYQKEYVDFVSKHRDLLQLKTMESIVSAVLKGHPITKNEAVVAAHTTNIIMYLAMTGRQKQIPPVREMIPLALAITSIEEMVQEKILRIDDGVEGEKDSHFKK